MNICYRNMLKKIKALPIPISLFSTTVSTRSVPGSTPPGCHPLTTPWWSTPRRGCTRPTGWTNSNSQSPEKDSSRNPRRIYIRSICPSCLLPSLFFSLDSFHPWCLLGLRLARGGALSGANSSSRSCHLLRRKSITKAEELKYLSIVVLLPRTIKSHFNTVMGRKRASFILYCTSNIQARKKTINMRTFFS